MDFASNDSCAVDCGYAADSKFDGYFDVYDGADVNSSYCCFGCWIFVFGLADLASANSGRDPRIEFKVNHQ